MGQERGRREGRTGGAERGKPFVASCRVWYGLLGRWGIKASGLFCWSFWGGGIAFSNPKVAKNRLS